MHWITQPLINITQNTMKTLKLDTIALESILTTLADVSSKLEALVGDAQEHFDALDNELQRQKDSKVVDEAQSTYDDLRFSLEDIDYAIRTLSCLKERAK